MRKSFAANMVRVGAVVCAVCFAVEARAQDQPAVPQKPKPPKVANPGAPGPASGWTLPNDIAPAPDNAPSASERASTSKSVKITYESSEPEKGGGEKGQPPAPAPAPTKTPNLAGVPAEGDRPQGEPAKRDPLTDSHFLHGFRLGYSFVANYDKPLASLNGRSLKDAVGTRSPHNFLMGYEVLVRMIGHSWLNVILLSNVIVGGLEQSKILPSGNALIGFELNNSFQVGVGAHITPLKGQEAHTAFAAGWTPRVGNFYIPVHAFFIPDVDGNHRTGMLSGVTW